MNKTKKNGTFTLQKIIFPVRGHQKPSTFASSDLTQSPTHKGEFFISKRWNYDNK